MRGTNPRRNSPTKGIGILTSGGLDSSILAGHSVKQGWRVQPIYIQCGLYWETDEQQWLQQFLSAIESPQLDPLVTLQLPMSDVYGEHWSITGQDTPAFDSPDQAVFLPGRNALLIIKTAIWCRVNQINDLAIATLNSNPFADSTDSFFEQLAAVLRAGLDAPLSIHRPFDQLNKIEVMNLGRDLPLELTFSCLRPVQGRHCGKCNKCRERQRAFQLVNRDDMTLYQHRSFYHDRSR